MMGFKVMKSICWRDLEATETRLKGGTKIPCDRRKWESAGDGVVEHVNRLLGVALKAQSSFINVLMENT